MASDTIIYSTQNQKNASAFVCVRVEVNRIWCERDKINIWCVHTNRVISSGIHFSLIFEWISHTNCKQKTYFTQPTFDLFEKLHFCSTVNSHFQLQIAILITTIASLFALFQQLNELHIAYLFLFFLNNGVQTCGRQTFEWKTFTCFISANNIWYYLWNRKKNYSRFISGDECLTQFNKIS